MSLNLSRRGVSAVPDSAQYGLSTDGMTLSTGEFVRVVDGHDMNLEPITAANDGEFITAYPQNLDWEELNFLFVPTGGDTLDRGPTVPDPDNPPGPQIPKNPINGQGPLVLVADFATLSWRVLGSGSGASGESGWA